LFEGEAKPEWKTAIVAIDNYLDKIAAAIKDFHKHEAAPKFHIERLPMGMKLDRQGKATVFSYNNSHVEWYHGIRRMYLPHYPEFATEAHPLQKQVANLLNGLRYKYEFVDNYFPDYAQYGNGALHCLSKVIARSPY
jgi:hypothetical protein